MSGHEEGTRPTENAEWLLEFFDLPARAEFEAPDVTDFGRQNPDGRLWRHRHAEGVELTEDFVPDSRVLATIQGIAGALRLPLSAESPILETFLPGLNARIAGSIGGAGPTYTVRRFISLPQTLDELAESGVAERWVVESLRAALVAQLTIIIIGPTGSGKTTLQRAILRALSELVPVRRFAVIEDTAELSSPDLPHCQFFLTDEHAGHRELCVHTLRHRPDSVMVAEARGDELAEFLAISLSGHPGGVCGMHAEDLHHALLRMEQFVRQGGFSSPRELIGEAVQLVVLCARSERGPRVRGLFRVHGFDAQSERFELEELKNPNEEKE